MAARCGVCKFSRFRRCMQLGIGSYVMGRRTLGNPDAPEIKLLSDGQLISFTNGAWSITVPEIAIFDATFVSENVFSGDLVSIGHKQGR
jgi:hypothetical protein